MEKSDIKLVIYEHPEFVRFMGNTEALFSSWQQLSVGRLKSLKQGCNPKSVIIELSEGLLSHYTDKQLIGKYEVYQHLMDYWATTMQDDCYLIAADGWKAETARVLKKNNKGKEVDKGWICDLVPKELVVARYFAKEQEAITELKVKLESLIAQKTELEEEQSGEEGAFSGLDKVNKACITVRMKDIKGEIDAKDEADVLNAWLKIAKEESSNNSILKEADATLDIKVYDKYPALTEEEIKTLVVEYKWLTALAASIHREIDHISQSLTHRVKELAERYEMPLPQAVNQVNDLEHKVNLHLERMGFSWK